MVEWVKQSGQGCMPRQEVITVKKENSFSSHLHEEESFKLPISLYNEQCKNLVPCQWNETDNDRIYLTTLTYNSAKPPQSGASPPLKVSRIHCPTTFGST